MTLYLTDIIKKIVDSMTLDCYYQFGYWPEIANDLMSKGKSQTLNAQRYPFLMLSAGWTEKRNTNRAFFAECNPSIYIVTTTTKNYSTEQRKELVYKAILDPIYEEFMQKLQQSKYFFADEGLFEHDKTDLYYLSNMESNQNKLNDIVDAIELKFSNLKILVKPFECLGILK